MKEIIILFLLLAASLSHAAQPSVGVFAAYTDTEICCVGDTIKDEDELSAGVVASIASEGDLYVGAEVFSHEYEPGVAVRAGVRGNIGDLSIGAGAYNPGDDIYFVEYATTNGWFVRYTRMDDYLDSSITRIGSPSIAGSTVEVTDEWYWFGYRFSLE
ncbi:MAG: hypothetical protein SV201_11685 [Pseudomonadota bacterium]|nr:hypothetical protein [Pseudomonadota bacterium]